MKGYRVIQFNSAFWTMEADNAKLYELSGAS